MKILNDIAKLDARIDEIYKSAEFVKAERDKLVQKLKNLCTHPETFDDGYDNPDGYGGDKWVSRITCAICGVSLNNKPARK